MLNPTSIAVFLFVAFGSLFVCTPTNAIGGLVAHVDAMVAPLADGGFRYQYNVTNGAASSLAIIQIELSVGDGVAAIGFQMPTGWTLADSDADAIVWASWLPEFDIQPGAVGKFEFTSQLAPGDREFSIAGFDDATAEWEVFGGNAVGPATRHMLFGDLDGNFMLDVRDVDLLAASIRSGESDSKFDVDKDGFVSLSDLVFWVSSVRRTWVGDASLDGLFDSSDLVQVFQAGEYEDSLDKNSSWSTGDWDADGEFSTSDLVIAFQDGGYEHGTRAATQAVPEPRVGDMLPVAIVGVAILGRFRPFFHGSH